MSIGRVNQLEEKVAIAEVAIGVQNIEENKTYLLMLKDEILLTSVKDIKEKATGEVA